MSISLLKRNMSSMNRHIFDYVVCETYLSGLFCMPCVHPPICHTLELYDTMINDIILSKSDIYIIYCTSLLLILPVKSVCIDKCLDTTIYSVHLPFKTLRIRWIEIRIMLSVYLTPCGHFSIILRHLQL